MKTMSQSGAPTNKCSTCSISFSIQWTTPVSTNTFPSAVAAATNKIKFQDTAASPSFQRMIPYFGIMTRMAPIIVINAISKPWIVSVIQPAIKNEIKISVFFSPPHN